MFKTHHFFYLMIALMAGLLVLPDDAAGQSRRGGRPPRFQNILEHDLRPYHFGFTLGVSTMDFALKPTAGDDDEGFSYILPQPDYGFHVGIVSNLKLGEYFDLRFIPTFSFGDRYIGYFTGDYNGPDSYDYRQVMDPYFLDFPLHIKYKSARMTNTRAYIIGGVKYSYDLRSFEGKDPGDDPLFIRTRRNDFHYEIGLGFDHYFYYFKFSTEIKASFGFRNLVLPGDPRHIDVQERHWTSIDRLQSRSIMISFLFE